MGLAAIQGAIVERISENLKGAVKQVGILPGDFTLDLLRWMLLSAPGVYVAFAGGTPPRTGERTTADLIGRCMAIVVTRNVASIEKRVSGDSTGPGALQLIDILVPMLHNFCAADEATLQLAGIENLYDGKFEAYAISVYAVLFDMPIAWPAEVDTGALHELRTLFANYDIPPHESGDQHRGWLRGDESQSKPDAKDSITLPQE